MVHIAAKPEPKHFIIRHHARLKGVFLGERKELGRIATGTVYEQAMQLTTEEDSLVVRRITIELDEPTQDGDTEIHLLTNLPRKVSGKRIAEVYHRRWEEETSFYYLRMCFQGELTSLTRFQHFDFEILCITRGYGDTLVPWHQARTISARP